MRTLSYPLLEAQLKDVDTLPSSPLRDFAADILVKDPVLASSSRYIQISLNGGNASACFLQSVFAAVGESLPNLVFHPLLKRKRLPGFLEEDARYPKESLACLSYLVFVHHQAADTFPCVFR